MASSVRLTTALIAEVCTRIKAGAFEYVAAEALGIPSATFQEWLERGRQPRAGGLYRQLDDAVRQARAHARLMAEIQLREKDAKVWLLNGPGRETATQPGWGSGRGTRVATATAAEQAQAREAWLGLCAALLQALTPFAEARAAAADVLARWQAADH